MMFIDLIEINEKDHQRESTLVIGASNQKISLKVLGELPHGYEFKPRREIDRDELVDWLNRLEYKDE